MYIYEGILSWSEMVSDLPIVQSAICLCDQSIVNNWRQITLQVYPAKQQESVRPIPRLISNLGQGPGSDRSMKATQTWAWSKILSDLN